MLRPALLLLMFLLVGAPSLGATALEQARAAAARTRGQVSELRSRQMSLRSELNEVARRIEALKSERRVLGRGELEASLRKSQALSGTLTQLAQSLSSAELDAERDNRALLTVLSGELNRLRTSWDATTDRAARQAIIRRMRTLREEREQVRAALPATSVPALESARPSDDPEDLLEQADALRDAEDKVRRELGGLSTRIRELREERELDRRMSEFLSESDMFDESDRRVRTQALAGSESGTQLQPGEAKNDVSTGGADAKDPHFTAGPLAPANERGDAPVPEERASPTTIQGQPWVGASGQRRLVDADSGDLESLERRQQQLRQLADELKVRAAQTEKRARALE